MHTPQHNPKGYDNTSIHDVESLAKNVRFLVMHGVADDNVHTQSTYTLLDKLDLAGVENYDVHIFPDSDHGIYFHNANKIVYDSEYFPDTFVVDMTNIHRRIVELARQCIQWGVVKDGGPKTSHRD